MLVVFEKFLTLTTNRFLVCEWKFNDNVFSKFDYDVPFSFHFDFKIARKKTRKLSSEHTNENLPKIYIYF